MGTKILQRYTCGHQHARNQFRRHTARTPNVTSRLDIWEKKAVSLFLHDIAWHEHHCALVG
jgi:G:T-mismatch repair DNA endonuclease (very short patch repair protein)